MDQDYIYKEQIKRIEKYVEKKFHRSGYESGETGGLEWIENYAKDFREVIENISEDCINCGFCGNPDSNKKCPVPLNEKRLKKLGIKFKESD